MSPKQFNGKLDRFREMIIPKASRCQNAGVPARYAYLAEALGGELLCDNGGCYCVVSTFYDDSYRHGNLGLADCAATGCLAESAFTVDAVTTQVDVSSIVFFDAETTGLGGAGAVPFLIGCGWVVEGGFEVRQYLLPDYADECAMLHAVLNEFGPDIVVATFNGAAFDLPILKDRVIINRVSSELQYDRHLDLLHPSRRLFRRRLGDCTLVNLERRLMGFFRNDDVPGYLVPSVYFDWLSEDQLTQMPAVMEHNRLDVMSLFFLAHLLAEVFQSEGAALTEVDDLHSLSRVYDCRKQSERVTDLYRRMTGTGTDQLPDDVLYFHSLGLKRNGHLEEAAGLWHSLSRRASREGYLASVELAKYYEHGKRDFPQALAFARRAKLLCPDSQSQRREIERRLRRLLGKEGR